MAKNRKYVRMILLSLLCIRVHGIIWFNFFTIQPWERWMKGLGFVVVAHTQASDYEQQRQQTLRE